MKKLKLLIISLVLSPILIMAQDIPMLFDVNMETYEVLDNPTSLNNGEIWQQDTQYPIYFDFSFEINGIIYSAVIVDASIGLTFAGFSSKRVWVWGTEWGGYGQLLNQGTDESLSPIDYKVVGDPGNKILKIQWTNAGIMGGEIDDPDDFVDFQMWVCEGSNRIEIHYGQSQTSENSFGYNNGPGCRFLGIDGNMGICVWGYPDLPSWDWIDMEGPVPGCLLNGVPSQDIVFNFFPNPTVSIEEKNDLNKLDFFIANSQQQNEIKLVINDFDYTDEYELDVFNMLGNRVVSVDINEKITILDQSLFTQGLYIFSLKNADNMKVEKVMIE